MIAFHSSETSELQNKIDNIKIPECPACPACPDIPACPNVNMSHSNRNLEEKIDNLKLECPECPACPEANEGQYPTVEDIVGGIYMPSQEFVEKIRSLCTSHNAILSDYSSLETSITVDDFGTYEMVFTVDFCYGTDTMDVNFITVDP